MTLTIHDQLEQGSEEWLQARAGIVTASVVGKLITPNLKVANNDTARGLIATLAAERITGHVEEIPSSWQMTRGVLDEPLARDHYAEHHAKVDQVGFMVRDYTNFKVGYSPDGLVGETGLIEIKSRSPRIHLNTVLSGQPPAANMAQMQTGLLVTGREWCDYISWCGGLPMWVHRVRPDPAWFNAITQAAADAETSINNLIINFEAATRGLPPTERIDHFQDQEIVF